VTTRFFKKALPNATSTRRQEVEHPTLASGLLVAWGLEKELRTAMWSLKQVLTIN